jgi:hypothetical protein
MSRALALMLAVTLIAVAQPGSARQFADVEYDGRFTFVRLRWESSFGRGRGFGAAWNHDYPRAEQHLGLILRELTLVDVIPRRTQVLSLDDPRLFNYPVAFMWEPGAWVLSDREAQSFRAYLLKGGFAVFEDFDGAQQWDHFAAQMQRVLPGARWRDVSQAHPIFDTFFRVTNIETIVHPMYGLRPKYYGIFEDNDPGKRLMVVANFDNDIPEYWEWSGEGLYPFDASNDAYKLGVNYVLYGLTH